MWGYECIKKGITTGQYYFFYKLYYIKLQMSALNVVTQRTDCIIFVYLSQVRVRNMNNDVTHLKINILRVFNLMP